MNQYEQLMQALAAAQGGYDQSYAALQPLEQDMHEASTRRFPRGLFGLGETIYDAYKQKQTEPQYQQALLDAMGSARGVDEVMAQLEAYRAQQEAMEAQHAKMEERAYQERLKSSEFERQKQLQSQKDAAAGERASLRNQPSYTYNIPAGYMPSDPNNPGAGVRPIPGSEQDREAQAAEQQAESKRSSALAKYSGVLDEVDQALGKVNNLTAGFVGSATSKIPGTDAYTLQRHLDTIKGNLGFDRLQQMREESKTGGALGQVSNIELNLLTSSLTALDPGLPPDQLRRNLQKVDRHYQNFLNALSGKMPEGYDAEGNPVNSAPQDDVDALIEQYLQ